jgi:hypothetical protein
MGAGHFSVDSYHRLRVSKSYDSKSRSEIFTASGIDPEMDPKTITLRESRDSSDHPESLSIIVGLDVTGSMGMVPEDIVKNSLPDLVGSIIEAGFEHPQVLFLALGDHVYDSAPLQVGQFESSAELLDRWLTKVFLEGGGGGNGGESYSLAHYFASRFTSIDCFEKRGQKGFLFTIGDEPCLPQLHKDSLIRFTAADEASDLSSAQVIEEAKKMYNVYHLHILHNAMAKTLPRQAGWKEILGDNFILLEDYTKIAKTIADLIIAKLKEEKKSGSSSSIQEKIVEDML